MKSGRKSGQVMLEYIVALGVFLAMVGLCALLLYVFKIFGDRALRLIAVS